MSTADVAELGSVVEGCLRELVRQGWWRYRCGPRDEPVALVAVRRAELWADVIVFRGHDRCAAYRTLLLPGVDPIRASHVVWHYLSDAERTLLAVLDIPVGVVGVQPYSIPQECTVPEMECRPRTTRPGRTFRNRVELDDGCKAQKGQRIWGEERARLGRWLAEEYALGASIRELANATGRAYGSVHRLLVEAGVVLRPQGGRRRKTAASPITSKGRDVRAAMEADIRGV